MKNVLSILILLFLSIHSYAQYKITKDSIQNQCLISKLDSIGINNEHFLNRYEVEYLNVKFEKERSNFDFTNKKIAFFSGSSGSRLCDKKDYFLMEKDLFSRGYSSSSASLVLFSEKQKQENGGYDAVVYCWSKILRDAEFYTKKLKKVKE